MIPNTLRLKKRMLLGVCILCALGANRVCAQSGGVRGATASEPNAGCFRGTEGAEVPEPENLRSVDGVLKVELAFRNYVDANGDARYCYVTPSGGVSPTLRVNPGDTVILNLRNEARAEQPARAGALGSAKHHGTMMTAETGGAKGSAAFDAGLMDKFPESVGSGGPGCNDVGMGKGIVMGYFDGNTVTGFWNYAQHFAMSDNSFSTDFGPSTVGAINLISGNPNGATLVPLKPNGSAASGAGSISGGGTTGAVIGDPRPGFDDCSSTTAGLANSTQITMTGKNIGDLLNAQGRTWGWFHGGFTPTGVDSKGRAVCGAHHVGLAGDDATTQSSDGDYIPHHSPFQYYKQTANPHHLPPSSVAAIGTTDQANHNYDLTSFWAAVKAGHMPAVSFLKAGAYQDGHPGYSDPIDEQEFVVNTINELEETPFWKSTAVIILYDDSDGWYDHQMSPIITQSNVTDDNLTAPGSCGVPKAIDAKGDIQNGRCGYGPRQPLLVISPYAKVNFVDHSVTDQSSVIRFIEDNWGLPRIGNGSRDAVAGSLLSMFDFSKDGSHKVFLDPNTGVLTKVE
jgi:phospholipase C